MHSSSLSLFNVFIVAVSVVVVHMSLGPITHIQVTWFHLANKSAVTRKDAAELNGISTATMMSIIGSHCMNSLGAMFRYVFRYVGPHQCVNGLWREYKFLIIILLLLEEVQLLYTNYLGCLLTHSEARVGVTVNTIRHLLAMF